MSQTFEEAKNGCDGIENPQKVEESMYAYGSKVCKKRDQWGRMDIHDFFVCVLHASPLGIETFPSSTILQEKYLAQYVIIS